MPAPVTLLPVSVDDAERVGDFLHAHLNPRVAPGQWGALVTPPWATGSEPDRGFQLVDDRRRVVGTYLRVHSTRGAGAVRVCNLAAFCVLPEQRQHALRLVRAVLAPRDQLYTDLSPSGTVPALNERLGFAHLDTTTRLVPNLGAPVRGVALDDAPRALETYLTGEDRVIFEAHRGAAAARHLLVRAGSGYAYLVYRRDRRKQLGLFASPLHVGGSPEVLRAAWSAVALHLLRRGFPMTLAERRVLGFVPPGPGRRLARPRPKMFRGGAAADVDYLYSEMTLLEW